MIKALRVDDRLLHGQVAVAWTSYLGIDTIVIANDKLIADETMQLAFKLAKPPEVLLSMKSLAGAVEVVNNPKHEARKILVITSSIHDAEYLCRNTGKIKHVVIGGQRNGEGRKKVSITVHMDDNDIKLLSDMNKSGIEIDLHAVPTSKKMTYEEIINEYKK
ncbi:MAG: PTS mannose transporter subunit IID [Clostridia bacterium BRH_c25]|nr:MAG: PTS mannose transporter subunit IID [Clostridia bacterium BRH_c25]